MQAGPRTAHVHVRTAVTSTVRTQTFRFRLVAAAGVAHRPSGLCCRAASGIRRFAPYPSRASAQLYMPSRQLDLWTASGDFTAVKSLDFIDFAWAEINEIMISLDFAWAEINEIMTSLISPEMKSTVKSRVKSRVKS